ncbi:MAG: nucleotidyltransferase domain-containing protein [Candidatus Bathyarchaeota archaeon]|nr:nucleotidyltransferase domain-containing protein [Candidatus Bathyarchaeota archaeon]
MLYHDYIETLLGSKVKVKILRTLNKHSGKEFTTRELASHIKVSHTGVRKALNDLYEMNAIRIKVIGKSHTVSLNRESYAASLIDKIFQAEAETLPELAKLLGRSLRDPSIASATIFGSVARGEEEALSDIDLLIIAEDKEQAETTVSEAQLTVSKRFGNPIAPYILTEADLADEGRLHILREIKKKNIPVRGTLELATPVENKARRKEPPPQLSNKG